MFTPISKRAPVATSGEFTPIFKGASDPYFNHKAAKAAFDLVMKMDDDEAEVFVSTVVADVVEETIEKNLRTVQRQVDHVVEVRKKLIEKALIRKAKENLDEALPYLEAYDEIAKAKNPYYYGYVWNENDFRRDPSTGQFQAKITHTQKKPIRQSTANQLGIKPPKQKGKNYKLTASQQAQYQDEYRQLSNFLGSIHQSTQEGGDANVVVSVQNKKTGLVDHIPHRKGTRPDQDVWDPKEERIIGVQAKPTELTAGGAAFSLQSALGGSNPKVAQVGNVADKEFNSFAHTWTQENRSGNSNERTYARLQEGSRIIGQVAPPGSKLQAATAFGQFVGSHGPEAEAVIGPTARKTAYRYRGTERAPDPKLVEAYRKAVGRSQQEGISEEEEKSLKARESRAQTKRRQEKAAAAGKPVESVKLTNDDYREIRAKIRGGALSPTNKTPTWDQRTSGRAEINAYLKNKILKDQNLYNLHLEAGNTPPSEGVLLNSQGQIVAQAVGYGDDHYLPFNLKNLKGLKGGEYIRSRTYGGPSSEDIYTGLMSGARQIQVVSNSGTFTVTFKDDFRGGRRHNDKARRMTKRYQQILDAVQSEQVESQSIKPNIMRMLREQALKDMHNEPSAVQRDAIKQRVKEFKANPELDEKDQQIIDALAEGRASENNTRDSRLYAEQTTNEILTEKQNKFRLDGRGYDAALQALAQQFPYYIAVDNNITTEKETRNLSTDKGYVAPGDIRPHQAKAGLHGRGANPKNKISAADADYAGSNRPVSRPDSKSDSKDTETQTEGANGNGKTQQAETKPKDAKNELDEAMHRHKRISGAIRLHTALGGEKMREEEKEVFPLLALPEKEFLERINTPEGMKEVSGYVEVIVNHKDQDGKRTFPNLDAETKAAVESFRRGSGDFERIPYDPVHALNAKKDRIYSFHGKGYREGDEPMMRERAIKELDNASPSIRDGRAMSALSDDELLAEVQAVEEVLTLIAEQPDLYDEESVKGAHGRRAARQRLLVDRGFQHGHDLVTRKQLERHAENVHRMRALKHDFPQDVENYKKDNVTNTNQIKFEVTPEGRKNATKALERSYEALHNIWGQMPKEDPQRGQLDDVLAALDDAMNDLSNNRQDPQVIINVMKDANLLFDELRKKYPPRNELE